MQRNAILGAIAAVLLAVAAYRIFLMGGPQAGIPTENTVSSVCLACKESVRIVHSVREPAPHRCPKCGETAAYPWLYCYDCKKRFIPNLVRHADDPDPRMPVMPACTGCGGTHAGSLNPKDPKQAPEGDAPLPNWPV